MKPLLINSGETVQRIVEHQLILTFATKDTRITVIRCSECGEVDRVPTGTRIPVIVGLFAASHEREI